MKVRSTPTDPDLKAEVIAILLRGWDAAPPQGVPLGPHGLAHGLMECFDPDGPARLWREHERWLRQMARTWGWTPDTEGPDGAMGFYAEHCAAFGDR